MTRNDQDIGPSREMGYSILFFGLTIVYAALAYQEFSNGEMKFGLALIALMLLVAGAGAFCLYSLLTRRQKKQKTKQ